MPGTITQKSFAELKNNNIAKKLLQEVQIVKIKKKYKLSLCPFLHLILFPQENHYNIFVCTILILETSVLFISVCLKQTTVSGIVKVVDKN